jgi:hypothetical protein
MTRRLSAACAIAALGVNSGLKGSMRSANRSTFTWIGSWSANPGFSLTAIVSRQAEARKVDKPDLKRDYFRLHNDLAACAIEKQPAHIARCSVERSINRAPIGMLQLQLIHLKQQHTWFTRSSPY